MRKSFLDDGLSIDETKASVLIIGLVIMLVFAMVVYYIRNRIGDNLTRIIIALITAIAGINGLNTVKDLFSKAKG